MKYIINTFFNLKIHALKGHILIAAKILIWWQLMAARYLNPCIIPLASQCVKIRHLFKYPAESRPTLQKEFCRDNNENCIKVILDFNDYKWFLYNNMKLNVIKLTIVSQEIEINLKNNKLCLFVS